MSSAVVRRVLREALTDRFPDLVVRQIENMDVEPVVDASGKLAAFLGMLFFATEQANGIGDPASRCWREEGTADVLVFWPAGRGADDVAGVADTIRAAFAGQEFVCEEPGQRLVVLTADPLSAYLARPGVPIGNYFVSMVGLSYQFDFHR